MYIYYIVYFIVLVGGGVRLNKYWNVEREREKKRFIILWIKKKYFLFNYWIGFVMIVFWIELFVGSFFISVCKYFE